MLQGAGFAQGRCSEVIQALLLLAQLVVQFHHLIIQLAAVIVSLEPGNVPVDLRLPTPALLREEQDRERHANHPGIQSVQRRNLLPGITERQFREKLTPLDTQQGLLLVHPAVEIIQVNLRRCMRERYRETSRRRIGRKNRFVGITAPGKTAAGKRQFFFRLYPPCMQVGCQSRDHVALQPADVALLITQVAGLLQLLGQLVLLVI